MKLNVRNKNEDKAKYLVLDSGYVEVNWIIETDEDIVKHARISTRDIPGMRYRPTKNLIRYLFEHYHTSPFEFPTVCLTIRAPKFVKEQWYRHRTATVNDAGDMEVMESIDNRTHKFHQEQEFSGRYSLYDDEFYIPPADQMLRQSPQNMQASSDQLVENPNDLIAVIRQAVAAVRDYRKLLTDNLLARERARIITPMNQYIVFDWKQDLWNLLWWLQLRREEGAQWEIRAYASVIEQVIAEAFPYTYEVWLDYAQGERFSATELVLIREAMDGKVLPQKLANKINKGA